MLLSIVGGGGSNPPPGFGGPSILLDAEGRVLLFDCGEDCLGGLSYTGYGPCDVEEVFVSHAHIDHWAGLPQLAVAKVSEGCSRLRVISHVNVIGVLSGILPGFLPNAASYEFAAFKDGYSLNGYSVRLVELEHTVPAYGVIIVDGDVKLAAVTSDTRPTPSVLGAVKGSRILLMEASLPSPQSVVAVEARHVTVSEFMEAASSSGADITVAYHLSPASLAELRMKLKGRVDGRVIVGVRGLQVSI